MNDSTVTTDSVDLISRKSSDENEEESDQEKEDKIKDQTAFTILKDVNISKKNKVKRKLPNWLANPSVVSVDLKNLTCKIDSFPQLDKIFIDKLRAQKISHFFPGMFCRTLYFQLT